MGGVLGCQCVESLLNVGGTAEITVEDYSTAISGEAHTKYAGNVKVGGFVNYALSKDPATLVGGGDQKGNLLGAVLDQKYGLRVDNEDSILSLRGGKVGPLSK